MKSLSAFFLPFALAAACPLAAQTVLTPPPAAVAAAPTAESVAFKAACKIVEDTGVAYQITGSIAHSFKFYDPRPLMVRQLAYSTAERTRIFGVGFRDGERFVIIFDVQPKGDSRIFLADEEGRLKLIMDSPNEGTPITRTPLPDDLQRMDEQTKYWIEQINKPAAAAKPAAPAAATKGTSKSATKAGTTKKKKK